LPVNFLPLDTLPPLAEIEAERALFESSVMALGYPRLKRARGRKVPSRKSAPVDGHDEKTEAGGRLSDLPDLPDFRDVMLQHVFDP
jgi:hypothetical protein